MVSEARGETCPHHAGFWAGCSAHSRAGMTPIQFPKNIVPTRQRAGLILKKGASHHIEQVALRRL